MSPHSGETLLQEHHGISWHHALQHILRCDPPISNTTRWSSWQTYKPIISRAVVAAVNKASFLVARTLYLFPHLRDVDVTPSATWSGTSTIVNFLIWRAVLLPIG